MIKTPEWIEADAYDLAEKFQEKLESAYKNGRDEGAREAWGFAGHLYSVSSDVTEDIYMSSNGGKGIGVAFEMPYDGAVEIYEQWNTRKQSRVIKSGDIVFNTNNMRNALVLHVLPNGESAQVAEFSRDSNDGIMVHCTPMAALEKRIDGAVNLLKLTANIERAE